MHTHIHTYVLFECGAIMWSNTTELLTVMSVGHGGRV